MLPAVVAVFLLLSVTALIAATCVALTRQNERLLRNFASLVTAVASGPAPSREQAPAWPALPVVPAMPEPVAPAPQPPSPPADAIALGTVGNDLDFPALSGGRVVLSDYVGRHVLLIFVAPGCAHSRALAAPLADRVMRMDPGGPAPIVMSTGGEAANGAFQSLAERLPVLLQEDWEAGQLYHIPATPAAYLLDENAAVASQMALGTAAVLSLAGVPTPPSGYDATPIQIQVPIGTGRPLPALQPGSPAASFSLPRLSSGRFEFSGSLPRQTLLVFLDPACDACAGLEVGLAALLPRRTAPHVLIISRGGDRSRTTRELRPRTLIDERGDVARSYGVLATPAAVLIDADGRVSSGPLSGRQAVSGLIASVASSAGISLPAQAASKRSRSAPLVSMILTTRDRPQFLRIALRCYQHQSYANRELVVIDDGDQAPADEAAITAAGGRLIRVAPGTRLGTKLNHGVEAAKGVLCQKMDDDDWYGPRFVETMVSSRLAQDSDSCRPLMSFMMPFLFFELAPWEIRRSIDNNMPGATLLFDRRDWLRRGFRNLPRDEDVWFFLDQLREGAVMVPVNDVEIYLAVRHHGTIRDRSHTWTHQPGGQTLERYLQDRPLYERGPEALLPDWAQSAYREIQGQMRSGS